MKLVVDKESLVSVADAIREKGGTAESLEFPQGFVDGINAIESGGGGNWYDFTVTITSECANGQELLDIFTPYLSSFENVKDIAIFTLMNENVVVDELGTALLCFATRMSNGKFIGKMLRYRSTDNLVKNVADMTTGYGITPYAGAVYYAKVVRIIA